MAANTGAIYQPVASTPPATLASWSLKTATQQGHPLPIHELSSAVLDHGPVPAGVTRQAGSPRCASAAVTARPPLTACSTQMALSPPLAIAQHRSVLRRLGGPPPRLWLAGRWPWRRSVAISAPACCLPNSSKRTGGRCGPSPLHHGPCGIGVGQQSLQVPQLCGRSPFHHFPPRCRSVRRLIHRQ